MEWRITFIVILSAILFLDSTSNSHSLSHKHRNQVSDDAKLVLKHSVRVGEMCTCDQPKLQVVRVRDHYPGRSYLPHCTVFHKCGEHSGCCATEALKCVAAEELKP
ncbi:hypothetical protein AVEN_63581-1 [Araneus ventricosus]|uniref:Uncharacterized protein n=1 Tax=Araneus ventricosus TaxID=182803 RepID=A0A4Y2UYB4_ARAVE|nr:hypothetical protein AVEN_63581-1 [Araneus ventricosus]